MIESQATEFTYSFSSASWAIHISW